MPIPDTPYTREEMYLNAMATGNSGGIPPVPYTRQEMYLDEIARNGGGGGGSGGGVLVVHVDADTRALDKTWQEIHDADFAVIKFDMGAIDYCVEVTPPDGNNPKYVIKACAFYAPDSVEIYACEADTANDYPVILD